ncbi:DUF6345 domain-containing protein [Bacillus sp. 3103sda1]|uniref:DUF6345 domain-containing protein n=1 Tax=Bacillus sp. 3103sda1 TaxID=2953808 RepID=UPI0020A113D4|nr:DUF6345 domain-containing protein [Bacillus sp. 3103sda1]MCP1123682.1 DUF6345 domain-containing protein [Bacillus sp. 3103sda1]
MRRKGWSKKVLAVIMTGAISLNLVPLSAEAANEFTVLGVGDYYGTNADLNNGDAYKFKSRMSSLGWSMTAEWYDRAVYHTDFTNFGNQSDILYFTGHGNSTGQLVLSEGTNPNATGYEYNLVANYNRVGGDIKGYTDYENEDAEWMIFAACSVANQTNWGRQLTNGLHHIFTYHNVSSDGVDSSIIDNFIDRSFGTGGYTATTMFSAWMNANRMYSEYDWAIIGHNNNKGDFVHGIKTGATSDIMGTSDVYRWKGTTSGYSSTDISGYLKSGNSLHVDTTQEELKALEQNYKYKFKVKPEEINEKEILHNLLGDNYKTTKKAVKKLDVLSSEQGTVELYDNNSFVFSRDIQFKPISKEPEEVIKEINNFISKNGGNRNDLVLKQVLPMAEETPEGFQIVTGYTVTFVQKLNGSYIDGPGAEAIVVGYDADGVNFYKRNVKEVTNKTRVKEGSIQKLGNAIGKFRTEAPRHLKTGGTIATEELNVNSAELVFYSATMGALDSDLVPAYKLNIDNTNAVYVNALTGEYINPSFEETTVKDELYNIPAEAKSYEYKQKYLKELNNQTQDFNQIVEKE